MLEKTIAFAQILERDLPHRPGATRVSRIFLSFDEFCLSSWFTNLQGARVGNLLGPRPQVDL